ncbi:MAG: hypothetical protein M3Q19_11025 [Pseudomonadota bacterium]|nr:hypothetical protein [Pseudomonadota bacterium]
MASRALIDTSAMARRMRSRIIRPESREILISRLDGSAQEKDLTSPVNCGGLGRIRHFRRETPLGWPENFLPIDPAARALGMAPANMMEAQVFQNAACAWRCWYCFVPFDLLGGDERRSEWVTADELVARYADIDDRPSILDLSGGSPDLTPEWIVWTIEALDRAGIAGETYLWSDDNLSTDLVFELLDKGQVGIMTAAKYGRVCCFKGFDEESFSFNTGAEPGSYNKQFERFARYVDLGIDLYAYVTLTGPVLDGVEDKVVQFHERLRAIGSEFPGRTVPLRIEAFGPVQARNARRDISTPLAVQEAAIGVWQSLVEDET